MTQFAKVSEVKVGTKLKADGGFTCIDEGTILTVYNDGTGLYVPCRGPDGASWTSNGRHYLDGQLSEGKYLGLELVR